ESAPTAGVSDDVGEGSRLQMHPRELLAPHHRLPGRARRLTASGGPSRCRDADDVPGRPGLIDALLVLPHDPAGLNAASCRSHVPPLESDAAAAWLPGAAATASSTRSPSGEVTRRLVNPAPGVVNEVLVMPAANNS